MTLVYVMGAGRSGSTVLGITLGNLPNVFYGGELLAWNHFRGVPITERADVESFWSAVADRIPARQEHHAVDFFPLLEHHRALLRPDRLLDRSLADRYDAQNVELIAAVQSESGCDIVVDSSHFPQRALRLARSRHLDVKVVYLVRDPRLVVASLRKSVQRRRPMGVLQANAYCLAVALLSSFVWRTLPADRRLYLRYEDLLADPDGTLERLGQFLGVDPSQVSVDDLEVGPLFQGNRVRHAPRLALDPAASEPSARPLIERLVTAALQWPLLWRRGYRSTRPALVAARG